MKLNSKRCPNSRAVFKKRYKENEQEYEEDFKNLVKMDANHKEYIKIERLLESECKKLQFIIGGFPIDPCCLERQSLECKQCTGYYVVTRGSKITPTGQDKPILDYEMAEKGAENSEQCSFKKKVEAVCGNR